MEIDTQSKTLGFYKVFKLLTRVLLNIYRVSQQVWYKARLLKFIEDYLRLSKTIKDYQRLSKTIKDYQKLSKRLSRRLSKILSKTIYRPKMIV